MIDALTELAEEEQAHQTSPMPGLPTLSSVLAGASPLPREAAFLGLAEDGLPVLLNLYDAVPGPILISGDQACGKTALLKTIASATDILHTQAEVQYSVITQYPNEWENFQDNRNNAGIYSTQNPLAQELLYSLVTWAHNNKGEQQSIILLIDDFEAVASLNQQVEQNLRWLLLRGPSRRVWPIITINSSRAKNMQSWMDFFRTRLFGRISNENESRLLTGNSNKRLDELVAGSEFAMREGSNWLNFWAPVIE